MITYDKKKNKLIIHIANRIYKLLNNLPRQLGYCRKWRECAGILTSVLFVGID